MRFKHILLGIWGLTSLIIFMVTGYPSQAQGAGTCENTAFMMTRVQSAYDRADPSPLELDTTVARLSQSRLDSGEFSDQLAAGERVRLYYFGVDGINGSMRIALAPPVGGLQYRLYRGQQLILNNGSNPSPENPADTSVYSLPRSGIYTLAIRRTDYGNLGVALDFGVRISAGSNLFEVEDAMLPSETDNLRGDAAVAINTSRGFTLLDSLANAGRTILLHPGALQDNLQYVADGGQDTQLRFRSGYWLSIDNWVDHVHYVDRTLVMAGTDGDETRIIYIEDFDIGGLNNDLFALTSTLLDASQDGYDIQGREVWNTISGLWIGEDCAGIQLAGNPLRRIMAELTPGNRGVLVLDGAGDDLTIDLLNPAGPDRSLSVDLSMISDTPSIQPVPSAAQIFIRQDGMDFAIKGDRYLNLATGNADVQRWDVAGDAGTVDSASAVPVEITLDDEAEPQVLQIDWSVLWSLVLFEPANTQDTNEETQRIDLTFRDVGMGGTASLRDRQTGTRTAGLLDRLTVMDDVITIVSHPLRESLREIESNVGGIVPADIERIHRKLLPAADSYLELVMYEGLPAYNGLALPGTPGYIPRGSNNLGGECYSVNTMLRELNCAPNGEVNPANGNYWYSVTDLQANGAHLDLMLTRSYNSMATDIDGPFGFGWNAGLRVDYMVSFEQQNQWSRQVDLRDRESFGAYAVALDLAYEPGGYITFTSPSGSRHQFVRMDNGNYESLSINGWRIVLGRNRTGGTGWTLQQSDGFSYEFDLAGRLQGYGYDHLNRWVTVTIPENALNGPGGYGDTPVILTDAEGVRQLDVYFDGNHHVRRSVLHPHTENGVLPQDGDCDLNMGCREIDYVVTNSLIDVTYDDNESASYRYSRRGIASNGAMMCYHSDPRAPQIKAATYIYRDGNWVNARQEPDLLPLERIQLADLSQGIGCADDADAGQIWQALLWSGTPSNLVVTVQGLAITEEYEYTQGRSRLDAGAGFYVNLLSVYELQGPGENFSFEYDWSVDPNNPSDGLQDQVSLISNPIGNRDSNLAATRFYYDDMDSGNLENEIKRIGTIGSAIREEQIYGGGFPGFDLQGRLNADYFLYLPERFITEDRAIWDYIYDDATALLPDALVDPNGLRTNFVWDDGHLRTATEIDAYGTANITHSYAYGVDGLATGLPAIYSQLVDGGEASVLIEYTWDALGRVTRIYDSSLHSETAYTVDYTYVAGECKSDATGCLHLQMTITDPAGAAMVYEYDTAGNLVDYQVLEGETRIRHSSYLYYDVTTAPEIVNELRAEIHWAADDHDFLDRVGADELCAINAQNNVLEQFYRDLTEPDESGQDVPIYENPLAVTPDVICYEVSRDRQYYTVIDSDRRTRAYRYDALGRIIQTVDNQGNMTEFAYFIPPDLTAGGNGRSVRTQVVATECSRGCPGTRNNPGEILAETTFNYGQLRELLSIDYDPVTGIPVTWEFTYQSPTSLGASLPTTEVLSELEVTDWQGNESIRWRGDSTPTRIDTTTFATNEAGLLLDLAGNVDTPDLDMVRGEILNNKGLIEQVLAGEDGVQTDRFRYCPQDGGYLLVIQERDPDDTLDCNPLPQPASSTRAWYDSYDRLVCEFDPQLGFRLIQYEMQNTGDDVYHTRVVSKYYVEDESCADFLLNDVQENPAYSEEAFYNAAGDLVRYTDATGSGTWYCYDQLGRLVSVRERSCEGDVTGEDYQFTYTPGDYLVREQHPDGVILTYEYNRRGQLTLKTRGSRFDNADSTVIFSAETTTYIYDDRGRLIEEIFPGGDRITYDYTPVIVRGESLEALTVTDPARGQHHYVWDAANLRLMYLDPLRDLTDDALSPLFEVNPRNDFNGIVYNFDSSGALWHISDPAGRSHTLSYDSAGYPVAWHQAQTGAGDEGARVVDIGWLPVSQTVSMEIEEIAWLLALSRLSNNQLSSISSVLPVNADATPLPSLDGDMVEFTYDPLGRISSIKATERDYTWGISWESGIPELTYIISANNDNERLSEATLVYDEQFRLENYRSGDSPDGAISYLYEIVDTNGVTRNQTLFGATATTIETAEGIRTLTEQNTTNPALVEITSPQNRGDDPTVIPHQLAAYELDEAGRITSLRLTMAIGDPARNGQRPPEDPPGDNPEGNVDDELLRFSRNLTARISYNERGLPVRFVDSNQAVETLSYDLAGNLISYQTQTGNTYTYGYDELNRVARITAPNGNSFYFRYNDLDLVTGICEIGQALNGVGVYDECVRDGLELEQYQYDALGRMTYQLYEVITEDTEDSPRDTRHGVGLYAIGFEYPQSQNVHLPARWGVDKTRLGGLESLGVTPAFGDNTIQYVYDATSRNQLSKMSIAGAGESTTSFTYDAYGQLDRFGSQVRYDYTYDGRGRISQYAVALAGDPDELEYDYAYMTGDGADKVVYTLPDGQVVTYTLSDAGLPTNMTVSDDGDASQINLQYIPQPSRPDVFFAEIEWADPLKLQGGLRFDLREQASLVSLGGNDFRGTYQRDAGGAILQQEIEGDSPFFQLSEPVAGDDDTSLYLLTINYDRNDLPTTVRLTTSSGQPVYTLVYNYDETGRIQTETRRFVDGQQQKFEYSYASPQDSSIDTPQLTSISVQIVQERSASFPQPVRLASMAGFALLLAFVARRRLRLVLLISGISISMILIPAISGQEGSDSRPVGDQEFDYNFTYDDRGSGNLTSVLLEGGGRTCLSNYEYDALNRLVRVSRRDGDETGLPTVHDYDYDYLNRLVRIRNKDGSRDFTFLYEGTVQQPYAVVNAEGEFTYMNRLHDNISLFQLAPDGLRPVFVSGSNNLEQVFALEDGTASRHVWLFDTQKRLIPLTERDVSNTLDDGCFYLSLDDMEITADAGIFLIDEEGIWDPYTNIYFMDGRTYNPEINRFLQRDPLGPDIYGDAYSYPPQSLFVPRQAYEASYLTGLEQFDQAQQSFASVAGITADDVMARMMPVVMGRNPDTFMQRFDEVSSQQQTRMQQLLEMREWMDGEYIDRIVRFDAVTGAIQMPDIRGSGQGQWDIPYSSVDSRQYVGRVFGDFVFAEPSMILFESMQAHAGATVPVVSSFKSQIWQPASVSLVTTEPPVPAFNTQSPVDILDWLGMPTIEQSNHGVEFIREMNTVMEMQIADWFDETLRQTMPQTPRDYPLSLDELRHEFFSDDIFGVRDALEARFDAVGEVNFPQYTLGTNADWLRPIQPPYVPVD